MLAPYKSNNSNNFSIKPTKTTTKHAVKFKFLTCIVAATLTLQLTGCATQGTTNPNQKSLNSVLNQNDKNANSSTNSNNSNNSNVKVAKIDEDDSKPIIKTVSLAPTTQRMGNIPEPRVIYFDVDSSVLSPASQEITKKHAGFLTNNIANNSPEKVAVQGHTDERGTSEYNLALGQRRAESVKRAMVLLGARADDIETTSFGKEKPILDERNEAAYAKNRRVEWSYPN